jgi:hypothetical protein
MLTIQRYGLSKDKKLVTTRIKERRTTFEEAFGLAGPTNHPDP